MHLAKRRRPATLKSSLESPYLLSMYTEESFRRTGVAKMIVQCAIEWSENTGTKPSAFMHQTPALYEKFGFKQTTEMRLML